MIWESIMRLGLVFSLGLLSVLYKSQLRNRVISAKWSYEVFIMLFGVSLAIYAFWRFQTTLLSSYIIIGLGGLSITLIHAVSIWRGRFK